LTGEKEGRVLKKRPLCLWTCLNGRGRSYRKKTRACGSLYQRTFLILSEKKNCRQRPLTWGERREEGRDRRKKEKGGILRVLLRKLKKKRLKCPLTPHKKKGRWSNYLLCQSHRGRAGRTSKKKRPPRSTRREGKEGGDMILPSHPGEASSSTCGKKRRAS